MPEISDYLVDPALTDFSLAYSNDELISERLFPTLEVPERSGFYYTFDKSKFRLPDSRRTGRSRANEVDYGLSKTAFGPLTERALEQGIEWEVRDTYPTPHDARMDATENVMERMGLIVEKEIADKLTDTSVVTNNTTLSGTDQFSDFANSDPFDVVQTGLDTIHSNAMVRANRMVIGHEAWNKMKYHPELLGVLSNDSIRVLTPELAATVFGVDEVIIGSAQYNTAAEGASDSMSYVWGKHIVLCYVPPRPQIKQMATGYTLRVRDARFVDRWEDQPIKTDFVRANDYFEPKLVSAEAAYLIKNAVA